MNIKNKSIRSTTILSIRRKDEVIIIGDGQVSIGQTIVKKTALKVRTLVKNQIIGGFAGSTADAFTLFTRLQQKINRYNNDLLRASIELAKDWRLDKFLRQLEAMLIVADRNKTLIISGNGDVLEPNDGLAAIGSGGNYALAAAKALMPYQNIKLETIAKKAMYIASDICVYTNNFLVMHKISFIK